MSNITVVAKVVAKKDSIESVKNALLKLIAPTRNEDGCIEYNLHQDNEDPALFIFFEIWEDAASLARHITTDHYISYVRAVEGKLEDKVVNRLTRVE